MAWKDHEALEGAVTETTALSCGLERLPSEKEKAFLSEMKSLRGTTSAGGRGALSEFTEMPCDIAAAELGSRASPVSGPARSPLRFLLAAVIALVIVAGVTVVTWMATDALRGLSVLALILATLVALTAGRMWGRAERERTHVESARLREQLRQAEAEYRAITENLPLLTWLSTPGDRSSCVYISPQVEAMFGYSPEEWSAEPQLFSSLLHPDDREKVLDAHERADADGGRLRREYRLVARDGRIVWVREESTTVRDAVGKALYAQTFLVDVSERKRADDEREQLRVAERAAGNLQTVRQRRLDFLREAGDVLGATMDTQTSIHRVVELAVHDLADWCAVDVLEASGELKRMGVAQAEPRRAEPSREPDDFVQAVIKSGRQLVIPALVHQDSLDEDRGEFGLPSGVVSLICVPLASRGRPLGALTLARSAHGPEYGADELALAEDLAARIGRASCRERVLRLV